jgi:hypothetical protein
MGARNYNLWSRMSGTGDNPAPDGFVGFAERARAAIPSCFGLPRKRSKAGDRTCFRFQPWLLQLLV